MSGFPLNPVDIGVALVLLVSGGLAYHRGAVHEVLAVAGWVGGILATIYGFPYARPIARDLISGSIFADLAAGAALFVTSLFVLSLLTHAIAARMRDSSFNVLDRSFGFVFGLARGAVVVCLVFLAFEWWFTPSAADEAVETRPVDRPAGAAAAPSAAPAPVPDSPPAAPSGQAGAVRPEAAEPTKPAWPKWIVAARSMPLIEEGAGLLKSFIPDDMVAGGTSARNKARAAEERARRARQAEERSNDRLARDLMRPEAKGPAADEAPAGYGGQERRELERLIETTK